MSSMRPWSGALVALGVAVSGASVAVSAPTLAFAGQAPGAVSLAALGTSAYAAAVPACGPDSLEITKGRLEGAAGSRFLTVRATNVTGHRCATEGWTRYRFLDADGPIGHRSRRNPGYDPAKPPVVVRPGRTARSVLSWVDPGAVPRAKCHPHRTTAFSLRISGIPGKFGLPLKARVCTTKHYRPDGTRFKVG